MHVKFKPDTVTHPWHVTFLFVGTHKSEGMSEENFPFR